MSSQTNTLTEGPLAKHMFLVSLPLALSNLLVVRFYGARHPKDVEKTVHSAAFICRIVLGGDFSDFVTRWHRCV